MVQLAVAVGLISKSGRDHCTGIRVFEADEHCPLEDAQLKFVTQLKRQLQCQTCYLLYRGCAISSFPGQMTLKDCCPASTNCIRFTANYCMDKGSRLTVSTLDHHRWSFRVNLSAVTILDLQLLVEASKGVPTYAQHLIHHNDSRAPDVMTDDRSLSWHGVCKDDVLHLTDPPVSTPRNYILDVTSTLARSSIGASIAGPEWRICRQGLNVEGRCVNRICRAFQRLVIHPHVHSSNPFHHMAASPTYMGLVHPSSIQPHCPVCRKDFTAEKYGFTDCIWAYDSRQHGRNWQMEDVCSKWQYVPEDQYQRFQLNTREWHNLTFIVRPPPSTPPADRQTMQLHAQSAISGSELMSTQPAAAASMPAALLSGNAISPNWDARLARALSTTYRSVHIPCHTWLSLPVMPTLSSAA